MGEQKGDQGSTKKNKTANEKKTSVVKKLSDSLVQQEIELNSDVQVENESSDQMHEALELEQERSSDAPAESNMEKTPSPEPVYDEPILTHLIIQNYDGDKTCGLYNGEGEATFKDGQHYMGQFQKGLMHGVGKYTWKDGVIYEGEFDNNKVTGKGTYYWPDGSIYEGEVYNGVRHGTGTFYSPGKRMSYTGDWFKGKRHGKGRMTYNNDVDNYYDGDWVNNVRHGWGTCRYPTGNVYHGTWFQNQRHGEGTMRWHNLNQMFIGQWEHGVQNGMGQHIWFLHRVPGSQYPLRNMYDGEFLNGKREGRGTYFYANGAHYVGDWKDNMKNGAGKFVFKNGRVYEGQFENDHIIEFPDFIMDGMHTPDLSKIRTRTPLPSEGLSVLTNESRNTYGPSFQLEVYRLLEHFPETDRQEEATQVIFVIMQYISFLRGVYNFYSRLGFEAGPDNTYVMSRMQFWRFLKDCGLHHQGVTLMEMDRTLAEECNQKIDFAGDVHNPYVKILFREFVNQLVVLAYSIFNEEHEGNQPVLAWCMTKMLEEYIMQNACSIKGYIFTETRRAANALIHGEQAYEVYKTLCEPRKVFPFEPSFKMRKFLLMLQDFKHINADLSAKAVVDVLADDDPNVRDSGGINLELEMTFLEFFEALVGCAQVYVTEAVVKDPNTPAPSVVASIREQSVISGSLPASRAGSGMYEEGMETVRGGGSTNQSVSPVMEQQTVGTPKTGDKSIKLGEDAIFSSTQESERHASFTAKGSKRSTAGGSLGGNLSQKREPSFVSEKTDMTQRASGQLNQSVASIHDASQQDEGESQYEEEDEEEEELQLDEATRLFNFWTHQVHIFFVRKFFPAAQRFALLCQIVKEKYANVDNNQEQEVSQTEESELEQAKISGGMEQEEVPLSIEDVDDGDVEQTEVVSTRTSEKD